MKKNKILIKIRKPANVVFEFTTNPINTPRWIKNIEVEETTEWPSKLGTTYRNKNMAGKWSEYIVTAFKQNKVFELTAKDNNYHVRYTYTEPQDGITEMEYFEWVDQGELDAPFTQGVLEELRSII